MTTIGAWSSLSSPIKPTRGGHIGCIFPHQLQPLQLRLLTPSQLLLRFPVPVMGWISRHLRVHPHLQAQDHPFRQKPSHLEPTTNESGSVVANMSDSPLQKVIALTSSAIGSLPTQIPIMIVTRRSRRRSPGPGGPGSPSARVPTVPAGHLPFQVLVRRLLGQVLHQVPTPGRPGEITLSDFQF